MSKDRLVPWLMLFFVAIGSSSIGDARGESPATGEAVTIRLVQPDRQAAEVLKLFEGARAPHPAAALAGWKRATRDPNRLGKPLEASIAMFNPDMAREWKVLDNAELRLHFSAVDGKPRWHAVVPHDDGTLSAAITAYRITAGAEEPPLIHLGRALSVERLGPAGAFLACQVGDSLVLGSSRDELFRGIGDVDRCAKADTDRLRQRQPKSTSPGARFDSGLVFDLAPGRWTEGAADINHRRAVALWHGLGCRRIQGKLGIKDDLLAMEATTLLGHEGQVKPSAAVSQGVDPSWLTWVPAEGVMAVVSLGFEPAPAFWDSAFALADRVERADPAHADVAPFRSRFNLMAAAAGARPEVDLWPHLRGVTACVMGNADHPGHLAGALIVLHTDGDASALRLATDVLPRLGSLLTAKKQGAEHPQRAKPGEPTRLGTVEGRSLSISRLGRDVAIAWGDDVLSASTSAAANPERSVAPLCTGWLRAGKRPPQRVGAFWPARCWPLSPGVDRTSPAWRVLAQGPPAVWWGWTEPNEAVDSIHYADLRTRVHDFLDKIPLDLSPLR